MIKRTIRSAAAAALCLILVLCTLLPCLAQIPKISLEDLVADPGNTRAKNPEYNYAWLDSIIVRDDAASIATCELVPVDSYPYSMTVDEFVDEMQEYMQLFDLNVDNVSESFFYLLKTIYYTLIALGMNEPDYDAVYEYLSDYGINFAYSNSDFTELYAQILYSCLKNNTFYVLYQKNIQIPKGVSIEYAIVIILAEALGITLPSGVETITGLALLVMQQAVPASQLNISENPSAEEGFYWAKLAVSSKNGFDVPEGSFDSITQAQKEYVDYAYFSSILAVKYKVKVNPLRLWDAMTNGDGYAVERLVLQTMLSEKDAEYDQNASLEELFSLACQNGWFELENEFYSDIYEYNVVVPHDCEKLWLTPFAICGLLDGGSTDFFTVKINGEAAGTGKTQSVKLGSRLQSIKIECAYNDGVDDNTATYVLNVRKAAKAQSVTQDDDESGGVLGKIEDTIKNALPSDNSDAAQRISKAFSAVREAVTTTEEITVVTTYSQGQTTEAAQSSTDRVGQSITTTKATTEGTTKRDAITFTTYPDDEAAAAAAEAPEDESTTAENVITRAAQAIGNNPVVAATPVSVVAIGTALGLIFSKRKKNGEAELNITDESYSDEE